MMIDGLRGLGDRADTHFTSLMLGALLIVAVAYTLYSLTYEQGSLTQPGPGLVPLVIGVALILVTAAVLVGRRGGETQQAPQADEDEPGAGGSAARAFLFTLVLVMFAVLLPVLGYAIAASGLLVATLLLFMLRPIWQIAIFAVGLTGASYVVFEILLAVPLPSGIFR